MNFFEKDGEIYQHVAAGGIGGGVTSYATVKASAEEAAAFRASQASAAEPAPDELKQDGPTVQEWVAAGYKASAYPPSGYASHSSAEDIAKAIQAEALAKVDADKLAAEAAGNAGGAK